jgi:hypothetical protein
MRRIAPLILLLCMSATACNGQDVDPSLSATVDSMLPKLEVLAGLKKLRPVALSEQTRDQLRSYIEQRLSEEMPPAELEGIRKTYVALGLVPDSLNIKALLLDLYQEQVAGYYDPSSDKFFLVKGTPVAMLRPVLAHELVHALQDQHVDLDSLIGRARGNDRQSAAQAAIEGQATLVMFAYLAQQAAGRPIQPDEIPDVGAQLAPAMDAQNSQFPVFKRAPRIIRETMVFPYVGGAAFVQKLWIANARKGFVAPLDSLLPQSTEQVLHGDQKFVAARDTPTELRFASGANIAYENTLGELEMGVLLSEHLGTKAAASGWDGDRYQLLADGVLQWASVWDDAAAADRFADSYRQIGVKRRALRSVRVERIDIAGRPGVLILDAPGTSDLSKAKLPAVRIQP